MTRFVRIAYVVFLYMFGIVCVVVYFHLDNSKDLGEFLKKADRHRTDWGLGFYALVGFIKLALITVGVALPIILIVKLIKERQ